MAGVTKKVVGPALFALLSGCTAVLGIHSAELDDSVSGTSTGTSSGSGVITGGTQPKHCTTVAMGCGDCLRGNCPAAIDACLADPICRVDLDNYGKCLPEGCVDDAKTTCAESFTNAHPAVGLCMFGEKMCSPACGKGTVDRCELYCGCMPGSCVDAFGVLGNSRASCMVACSQLQERDKNCRWNHCEFAGVNAAAGARHCPHALPTTMLDDVCNGAPPPKAGTCLAGAEPGFPCHENKECCHNECPSDQVCR